MDNIVVSLGEKISKGRDAKGWSQEELAHQSGISRRTIQNIEGSKVESPGVDVVVKISRALGLSITYLIDDKPTIAELILDIQSRLSSLDEKELGLVSGFIDDLLDRRSILLSTDSAAGDE